MGIFVRKRAGSAVALGGAVAVTLGLVSIAPDARGLAEIQQLEIGAVRLQAEVVAIVENAPSDVVSVLTDTIDAVVTSVAEDVVPQDESPVDEGTTSIPDAVWSLDESPVTDPVAEVESIPGFLGTGSQVAGFQVLSVLMSILAVPLVVLFSPVLLPLVFIVGPMLGAVMNGFSRSMGCMYCVAASVASPLSLPEIPGVVAPTGALEDAVVVSEEIPATLPQSSAESGVEAPSPQRQAVRTTLRKAATRGNRRVVPASAAATSTSESANPVLAGVEGPSRSTAAEATAPRADRSAAARATRGR